jgi:hypothetical protein
MPSVSLTAVRRLLLAMFACFSGAMVPHTVAADDKLLGFSITPGIGVRLMDITVTNKGNGTSGTITNDGSFFGPMYLSVDIESPAYLLSDKIGVSVRTYATKFDLDTQRVESSGTTTGDNDLVDLGTNVSGYYSYVTPTLFYRISEQGKGDTRIGVGYGWWKAWFSGDIALAPGSAADTSTPKSTIDGSIRGEGGWMLFWQTRGENAVFEISFNGVTFSSTNYRYEMQELNMMLGYQLRF